MHANAYKEKTVAFFTLGCKVNQYETQEMREAFVRAGYREVDVDTPASVCVINTCTVTASADRKSRYFIHRAHAKNPHARIVVTGCYAQLDSEAIRRIHGVTHLVGNRDKHRILEVLCIKGRAGREDAPKGIRGFFGHTRAFLKIQDGCNNMCSYCKVPLVRGSSKSRPFADVLDEAERLAQNGFKELVLCGICLGAYGRDLRPRRNLAEVLGALENIDGLLRIRLSSIESADVSQELIRLVSGSTKICRHLHIPIQSGDDRVLRLMNRRCRRLDYLRLFAKIKEEVPDVSITTDIITGFPGEEESCFENTIKLVNEVMPSRIHVFPFSPRRGTAASRFECRVPAQIAQRRAMRLRALAAECGRAFNKRFLGRAMPVLIEERIAGDNPAWRGYTDNYIPVRVNSGRDLSNNLIPLFLRRLDADGVVADFC